MKPVVLLAALLLLAAPADAGAMAAACMSKPSARPAALCSCLENALRARLTAEEMRIEILAFKGKYREYNRKVAALGPEQAQAFKAKVAAALQQCQ